MNSNHKDCWNTCEKSAVTFVHITWVTLPAGAALVGGVIFDISVVREVGSGEVGPDAVAAAEVVTIPLTLGVGGAVALAVAAEVVVTVTPEETTRRGWKRRIDSCYGERKWSSFWEKNFTNFTSCLFYQREWWTWQVCIWGWYQRSLVWPTYKPRLDLARDLCSQQSSPTSQ